MIPDDQDFFQAMVDDPDDMARLVFADWLEEHGETERAEFIRVQCQISRVALAHSNYRELDVRQDELYPYYERAIQPSLDRAFRDFHPSPSFPLRHTSQISSDCAFRDFHPSWRPNRGLPHIVVDESEFPILAGNLVEPLPWFGVSLIWSGPGLEKMRVSPLTNRVVSLDYFYRDFKSESMGSLLLGLESMSLANLSLGHSQNFSPEAMRRLSEWPGLSRVRQMYFSFSELTDEAVSILANSRYLNNLRLLQLNNNNLTGSIAACFNANNCLGSLRWSGLTGCGCISRGAVHEIANSASLPSLQAIIFGQRDHSLPFPPVEWATVGERTVALVPDGVEGEGDWYGSHWHWKGDF